PVLGRGRRLLLISAARIRGGAVRVGRMPAAFLPDEDQGILLAQVQLPAGATQERTLRVLDKVQAHFLENEQDAVESVFTVAGFSFGGTGQNMGLGFVRLRDWSERPGHALSAQSVAGRAMGAFMPMRDAMAFAFAP